MNATTVTPSYCETPTCRRPLGSFCGTWVDTTRNGRLFVCDTCYLLHTAHRNDRVMVDGTLTRVGVASLRRATRQRHDRDPERRARRVRRYVTGDVRTIRHMVAMQSACDTMTDIRTTIAATRRFLADWVADVDAALATAEW